MLILSNVARLTPAQNEAIENFLADRGGVLVALGDRCEAKTYNEQSFRVGQGWLPASLIEPIGNKRFRARAGEPFAMTAEGTTPEEALSKFHEVMKGRLANGARVVPFEVPNSGNPWLPMAGIFKDDPYFDEWVKAMKDYRQQVEEDPDYL